MSYNCMYFIYCVCDSSDCLGRPTYISVDLHFTRDSSFFFSRRLISEVAERNSTKIGHMVGIKCNLQTHVQNLGYPFPYKSGVENHLFWTTSQLNGKFSSLYLRSETWCRQSVKCVDNCKGSPTLSQSDINFGPQTASDWNRHFTRPT